MYTNMYTNKCLSALLEQSHSIAQDRIYSTQVCDHTKESAQDIAYSPMRLYFARRCRGQQHTTGYCMRLSSSYRWQSVGSKHLDLQHDDGGVSMADVVQVLLTRLQD